MLDEESSTGSASWAASCMAARHTTSNSLPRLIMSTTRCQTSLTGSRADLLSNESLGESSSWGQSVPNGMARTMSLSWPERGR
eukprot:13517212-Heterocapsa_arctica.AAC.1